MLTSVYIQRIKELNVIDTFRPCQNTDGEIRMLALKLHRYIIVLLDEI